jgi:hypothetical protein
LIKLRHLFINGGSTKFSELCKYFCRSFQVKLIDDCLCTRGLVRLIGDGASARIWTHFSDQKYLVHLSLLPKLAPLSLLLVVQSPSGSYLRIIWQRNKPMCGFTAIPRNNGQYHCWMWRWMRLGGYMRGYGPEDTDAVDFQDGARILPLLPALRALVSLLGLWVFHGYQTCRVCMEVTELWRYQSCVCELYHYFYGCHEGFIYKAGPRTLRLKQWAVLNGFLNCRVLGSDRSPTLEALDTKTGIWYRELENVWPDWFEICFFQVSPNKSLSNQRGVWPRSCKIFLHGLFSAWKRICVHVSMNPIFLMIFTM